MSYFSSMINSLRYQNRLVQITNNAKRQPASATGAENCQRSGVCCWRRPCDLFPGDIERLAANLGLTVQETFKQYLIVDAFSGGDYRLLPRRGEQEGGIFLTVEQTYDIDTPCVFLDTEDNNCKVHDAKPTGGAHWTCSMTESEHAALPKPRWAREELMSLGWDGEESDGND